MKSAVRRMVKGVLLISGLLYLVIGSSCKKKNEIRNAGGIGIPYNNDSLMPTNPLVAPKWMINGVRGVFIVNKQERIFKDAAQQRITHNKYWQQAIFFHHAGTVSLNDTPFVLSGAASSYWNSDTMLWNNNGANTWYASGSSSIPYIREITNAGYPGLYGALPDTLYPNMEPFRVDFDNMNTVNADSAYLILYAHKSRKAWFSEVVSVDKGKASIRLSSLDALNLENQYFTVGNEIYYGALIEIVLFNYEIRLIDSKPFAFVRQSQILHNVVFYQR